MLSDEMRFKLLRLLEANPEVSQRAIAKELGISVGRVNYCLNALIEKGFVKAENFRRSPLKKRYIYLVTPAGIEEKAQMTVRFLRRKLSEYEALEAEIAELRREAQGIGGKEERP